jgi:antirestriction protein ArdC
VDGFAEPEQPQQSAFARIQEIEAFVGAINATVRHGFSSAQYRRDLDEIQMPHRDWFHTSDHGSAEENYYAVLFHELTHWTGAEKRLNRVFGQRFGDEAYAMEELVAEIGAAFLCSVFGMSAEPRPDHAAYVGSWLKVLRNDNRAIFAAASKAQEAYEHLAYLATTPTR